MFLDNILEKHNTTDNYYGHWVAKISICNKYPVFQRFVQFWMFKVEKGLILRRDSDIKGRPFDINGYQSVKHERLACVISGVNHMRTLNYFK